MPDESRPVLKIPREYDFLAPIAIEGLVRLGRHNDGGYIVPAFAIRDAEFLIAMGINDDWSFETQFKSINPQIKIHAYDHTISRSHFKWRTINSVRAVVRGQAGPHAVWNNLALYLSFRKFFGATAGVQHFAERVQKTQNQPGGAGIATIFDRASARKIFLKIDIEGSEYEILDYVVTQADRVTAIVAEFHDIDLRPEIFATTVKNLLSQYEIVHVHANNYGRASPGKLPEVLEITFVPLHSCKNIGKRTSALLEGLDEPNDPAKPDYALTFA